LLAVRAAVVGVLAALATAAVRALVTDPLTRLAHAWVAAAVNRDPTALLLPLDQLVLGGAALALTVCWLWLLLGVVSTSVAALHPRAVERSGTTVGSLHPRLGPRWVRSLTAVALGVAALHGPAHAEPTGERHLSSRASAALSGLPLPDRATGAVPVAASPALVRPAATVLVRPGDSLWTITTALLPSGTSPKVVDRAWREIAAANAGVLGRNPDLIFPGTTLVVPPLDRLLRKETP
jgi:hypothetical protein